jgi:hypothetical protein
MGLILADVESLSISAAFGALAITAVQAQEIGDRRQGRRLALNVCGSCHAVLAGQTQSPLATAPSFDEMAKTPGMTAAALAFWVLPSGSPEPPLRRDRQRCAAGSHGCLGRPCHDCVDIAANKLRCNARISLEG